MSLIKFPKLDKRTYIIITFIIYGGISDLINTALIDGIQASLNQYFDKICQFVIYIPYFIYLKMQKNIEVSKVEKEQLASIKIKTDNSKSFTKKDIIIFIIIITLDMIKSTLYTMFDKEFKEPLKIFLG